MLKKIGSKKEVEKARMYYNECLIIHKVVDGVLEEISVIANGSEDKGTLNLTPGQAEALIDYFNTEWKR